jgi:predicted metalloprotease
VRTGGLGLGGLLLLMVLGYCMTGDPLGLLGGEDVAVPPGAETGARGTPADEAGQFVSAVLADTERTWESLFAQMERRYEKPTVVLFNDAVQSACGLGSAAVGPFYCPRDGQVYLDLSFFVELDRRFGAPGDFAQAYVIAHEVGHHVQNQMGLFDQMARQRATRTEANALSVRQELQADCFAGVWGHYAATRGRLHPGDVEEGLTAAAAIGDDRIQRRTQGQVTPETWTHGSSQDRARSFRQGLESGQIRACDTT